LFIPNLFCFFSICFQIFGEKSSLYISLFVREGFTWLVQNNQNLLLSDSKEKSLYNLYAQNHFFIKVRFSFIKTKPTINLWQEVISKHCNELCFRICFPDTSHCLVTSDNYRDGCCILQISLRFQKLLLKMAAASSCTNPLLHLPKKIVNFWYYIFPEVLSPVQFWIKCLIAINFFRQLIQYTRFAHHVVQDQIQITIQVAARIGIAKATSINRFIKLDLNPHIFGTKQ
jgi:hypothetical protein